MMLQTILQQVIASTLRGIELAKGLAVRGVQAADAALPASPVHRKWVIVGFFSLPVMGAVVAIAGSGQNSLPTFDSSEAVIEAIELNLAQQDVFSVDPLVAEEKNSSGRNPG